MKKKRMEKETNSGEKKATRTNRGSLKKEEETRKG